MNFLDILKTSAVNLWRNKGRTILTIIAISIGAFTVALTSSVNTGVNSYIDKQLAVFGSSNSLQVQAKQETSTLTDEPQEYKESDSSQTSSTMKMISDSDIEKIRKVKGVKSSEGYKTPTLDYIKYKDGKKLKTSSREVLDSLQIDLAVGSAPDNDSNELELSLPQNMVSPLGFSSIEDAIGKTIKIQVTSQATGEKNIVEAKIVGVMNKNLIQNGYTFLNSKLNQKIYDLQTKNLPQSMTNQYLAAFTELEPGYETDEKIGQVKKDIENLGYVGYTIDNQISMVKSVIDAVTGSLILFGAIALLAASFGIINTLFISVQERTREIGLMKAMGLSNTKVFTLFSVEAIMIGLWGSVLGILVAMIAGSALNSFALDTFLKGMDGFYLTEFNISNVSIVIIIIMVISFLAGTLPSRKAAKQDPIDALRYE
jgi:putative ABC transport system permease protein